MNIKAIFSDIDGTLLTSHHEVSKKTIKAIRKIESVKKLIRV